MTYQPYLVANFATGVDVKFQPWLTPDDAQEFMYDGYVYRGVMSKRPGYQYFATGQRGGSAYRESRIVHTLSAVSMSGAINSSNKVFTLAGTVQIARGSITVTGSNPSQTAVDNGNGGFVAPASGSVNYVSGAISVTLNAAPTSGTVKVTYSFYPDLPVMMIATFITATNIKESIVADTMYVNRYNSNTNIYEDISPATPYTGTFKDFFTWVNYADADDNPRLLFSNNVDPIQQYDGTTVTDYAYTLTGISTLTASYMVNNKDRLILLRTTEDGVIFPRRIRISGTGVNTDVFDTSATGAGFIDIPDGSWIQGASFNRDDLIIFTETSTWVLKYTGDDTTPFVLTKIDESRGSDATFSAITYLNRTTAASKRGLIISDGYRVERQDDNIPDFTFNEIDGSNFGLCFAGTVDEDRDHYLIYPRPDENASTRILVTNYDEDNYAFYRLPLSCMGTYITSFDITWDDLLIYPDWASLSVAYGDWNSFAFSAGAPISLGGGHHGEIWRLNVTEVEDNQVVVRNITIIDTTTIEITTDWNNYSLNFDDPPKGADYIFLTDVGGMIEVNDQQFQIIEVTDNNTFRVKVPNSSMYSAYTSGGLAQRVIPFTAQFKQFNPYINMDKKVRCGWLYMYVSTSGTNLQTPVSIVNASQTNPAVITTTIAHNLQTGDQVNIYGVGGMTQLNNNQYFVTVLTSTTFALNGIDATGFGAYTSGGYAASADKCKVYIDVLTNDNQYPDQLNVQNANPYQGSCTNLTFETGVKKWYKVFINQTGRFIQFRVRSQQAGAKISIHAIMPGFQPVGRLI